MLIRVRKRHGLPSAFAELRLSRALVYSETMFVRRLSIRRIDHAGERHACPIRQIDSFAMRNFTNDAVFDDTFPAADGLLEAGHRVPLDRLEAAMEDWFRRKGYLKPGERLEVIEEAQSVDESMS